MTATEGLAVIALAWLAVAAWWGWRHRPGHDRRTRLERILDDHATAEAIFATRDDTHASYAFPPAALGGYARLRCGCVRFLDGEPRWLLCPRHVNAEIDGWRT